MDAAFYQKYYEEFYLIEKNFSKDSYEQESGNLTLMLRNLLPSHKQARILEIGCGVGFLLYFLRKSGYENLTGVDISEHSVELCRQYVTNQVVCADAISFLSDLSNSNQIFDSIYCFDTLEHFSKKDVMVFFERCSQILNPGGQLVIKVGNMANITSMHLAAMDFTHITSFTEESLAYLFRRSEFERCIFLESPVVLFKSKIKRFLEKAFHRFIYFMARRPCPKVVSIKIIAVGVK